MTFESWSSRVQTTRSPPRPGPCERPRVREDQRRRARTEDHLVRRAARAAGPTVARASSTTAPVRALASKRPPTFAGAGLDEVVVHRLDAGVDRQRARRSVETDPAVGQPREAVAEIRQAHAPQSAELKPPCRNERAAGPSPSRAAGGTRLSLSSELGRVPVAITLMDEPVVLFRDRRRRGPGASSIAARTATSRSRSASVHQRRHARVRLPRLAVRRRRPLPRHPWPRRRRRAGRRGSPGRREQDGIVWLWGAGDLGADAPAVRAARPRDWAAASGRSCSAATSTAPSTRRSRTRSTSRTPPSSTAACSATLTRTEPADRTPRHPRRRRGAVPRRAGCFRPAPAARPHLRPLGPVHPPVGRADRVPGRRPACGS